MNHSPDSTSKEPENPWLLFQPFFSSEDVIYFPPASSTAPHPDWKNRISDFALMKISSVTSEEEFELFKDQQLLLVDQIKQMKLLLDILPEERKFFEQKAYECLIQKLLPDFERFEMHRQFINDNSLI
uniref:Uncharacterized protein n=1 Tax=Acrobeloides nanus TaxID=290746 RepID=A0A914EDP6_9BILA